MNAGKMDRRVQLLRGGALVHNGIQRVQGPDFLIAEVWAQFSPGRGSERRAMAEDQADAPVTWRIRYSAAVADLNPRDRLQEMRAGVAFGPVFDIKSVVELGRREGLEIVAIARTDQGAV